MVPGKENSSYAYLISLDSTLITPILEMKKLRFRNSNFPRAQRQLNDRTRKQNQEI